MEETTAKKPRRKRAPNRFPRPKKITVKERQPRTPMTYNPKLCDQLLQLADAGINIAGCCRVFGISAKTWYDWKAKHPEFKEAAERHATCLAAWADEKLVQAIDNPGTVDVKAMGMFVRNRVEGFEDTSKTATQTINIGTLNQIENLTYAQLQQEINKSLTALGMPPLEGEFTEIDGTSTGG